MSVGFPGMVHLKSTLAISAVFFAGLLAASPYPYEHSHAAKPVEGSVQGVNVLRSALLTRAEAKAAGSLTTWSDPPEKIRAEMRPALQVEESTRVDTPAIAAPAHKAAAQARQGKTEKVHRIKVSRAIDRQRLAAVRARRNEMALEQVAPEPARTNGSRIDPIGDILRGLGIAKEG